MICSKFWAIDALFVTFEQYIQLSHNKNPFEVANKSIPGTVEPTKPVTQKKATMINTVAFSSDMRTLFLIDEGRAFSFSLDSDNGVYVGLVKGQVTAVSTIDDSSSSEKRGKVLKLTTAGAQWTIFYNRRRQSLAIIGATDIDSSMAAGPEDGYVELEKVKAYLFNLKENVVNIRRVGNAIELTAVGK